MTRKHLNPLAKNLGWKLSRIISMEQDHPRWMAEQTFWDTVYILVTHLQKANPNVDRDRFVNAVKDEAERISKEPVFLFTA
jgi:hypothetical protein